MESTAAKAGPWAGRIEDDALLRGAGRFGDDVKPEGALAACFVRSPHAFANIERIDIAAAKNAPGVVAVLTAADLAQAHYHSISHPHPIPGRGGKVAVSPHRPSLAEKRVMHVGEPVAMVIATSAQAAQDAAEKVAVDYKPLAAVTDVREAVKPGAPQLWPEAPGNIGFDWSAPADPDGKKQAALERAFKDAAHVVRVELVNQRLVVASLEPRTASASYDASSKQFTLRCGTQGVAAVRGQVAGAMGIKPEELRVLTDDLGGGFGMKGWCYPEYIPMLHAARLLEKPIHWVSTRAEAFVVRQPGPRLVLDCRACAQRARKISRPARRLPRQCRRLYHRRRAFRLHHAYLRLPADGLRHPAGAGERALRAHQHAADRALSRRRPPGGELSDGAADRCRRRCDRHRRRRIAPAQSDRARQNSLHHRLRQHLRQRRISGGLRARARARRLRRLCRAPEGGEKGRQIARHRHRLLSGDRRRLSGRSRAHLVSRRQCGQCQHRRRRQRAGASRRCSAAWRRAGSASRRRR